MPKVMADNEEVNFQEGIPESPLHIYELLMGAFAEQKRSVIKFKVDGEDCLQSGKFPEHFELIEAESLSHDEITLRLSIELLNSMSNLGSEIDAYQVNILSIPWTEVFKQMDQFISKIQPFADLIDHVLPYAQSYSPSWKNELEEIAKRQGSVLDQLLKAFERSDPAGLSNELIIRFLPLHRDTCKLFTNEVIPSLKKAIGNEDSIEAKDA